MARNTPLIVLSIVVVAVLIGFGTGVISPQTLNIGQPPVGGVPVAPQLPPTTGQGFAGQLQIDIVHRDTLDNAETRTEGVNIASTFYKSSNEITFNTIGSGTGNIVTITPDMNSILYVSEVAIAGQNFFISPTSTADQNLNPRIINFFFQDVTADGELEWIFKLDLRDMPPPVAGQTASTLQIFVNSFDVGTFTLNSPPNITGVGTGSNIQNFILWEMQQPQETASAQFEYEVVMDNTDDQKWSISQSNLEIPNVGIQSLNVFEKQETGSEIKYSWMVGDSVTLDNSNYVTTNQNANTVKDITFKFVTSLATNDNIAVTLNIKSLNAGQGTNPVVTDTVNILEA